MQTNKQTGAKTVKTALFFLFLGGALILSFLPASVYPAALSSLGGTLVRALAAATILFLLSGEGMLALGGRITPKTPATLSATVLIFLVALNNFPFLELLSGAAVAVLSPLSLFFYILGALATAAFEESLFRGLLFPLVRAHTKRTLRGELAAILLSSALFALLHLINLIEAPLPDTLLQVAYTFGIGLLSSLLYLLSGGLLLPFLFHALYNFGGLFLPTFGTPPAPAPFTVIFTAALAATAGVLSLYALRDCCACNQTKK
jgi:membrane protease YdiL (CAAX protease family)